MTALVDRAARAAEQRAQDVAARGRVPATPEGLARLALEEARGLADEWEARGLCTRRSGHGIVWQNAGTILISDPCRLAGVPAKVAQGARRIVAHAQDADRRAAEAHRAGLVPLPGVWAEAELEALTSTFAKVLSHYANHTSALAALPAADNRAQPVRDALRRCLVLATMGMQRTLLGEPSFSTLDRRGNELLGTVTAPEQYAQPAD
jgi:hypothetical protein